MNIWPSCLEQGAISLEETVVNKNRISSPYIINGWAIAHEHEHAMPSLRSWYPGSSGLVSNTIPRLLCDWIYYPVFCSIQPAGAMWLASCGNARQGPPHSADAKQCLCELGRNTFLDTSLSAHKQAFEIRYICTLDSFNCSKIWPMPFGFARVTTRLKSLSNSLRGTDGDAVLTAVETPVLTVLETHADLRPSRARSGRRSRVGRNPDESAQATALLSPERADKLAMFVSLRHAAESISLNSTNHTLCSRLDT